MGISDTNVSTSYDLASPGKRLLAYMIDLSVVFLLVAMEVALDFLPIPDNSFTRGFFAEVDNVLLITALAYFCWAMRCRTGRR